MYKLYIGNKNYSSWSLRPWILLSELGIPFTEQLVPLVEGGSWEKYRAFSPTGLVPCLHDGNTIVWESMAITEYVAESYPKVWPQDAAARNWARAASAEMHASFHALRNECPMSVGVRIRPYKISSDLQKNLDRIGELWRQGLQQFGGPFLAGPRFTAVDAFYSPVAFRAQSWQLALPDDARTYVRRLLGLRGMRAWAEAALTEPYSEPDHERELVQLGEILHDLRRR